MRPKSRTECELEGPHSDDTSEAAKILARLNASKVAREQADVIANLEGILHRVSLVGGWVGGCVVRYTTTVYIVGPVTSRANYCAHELEFTPVVRVHAVRESGSPDKHTRIYTRKHTRIHTHTDARTYTPSHARTHILSHTRARVIYIC